MTLALELRPQKESLQHLRRRRELSMSESLAVLFRRIPTRVYVVGVAHAERRHAFTAAWLIQALFDHCF